MRGQRSMARPEPQAGRCPCSGAPPCHQGQCRTPPPYPAISSCRTPTPREPPMLPPCAARAPGEHGALGSDLRLPDAFPQNSEMGLSKQSYFYVFSHRSRALNS